MHKHLDGVNASSHNGNLLELFDYEAPLCFCFSTLCTYPIAKVTEHIVARTCDPAYSVFQLCEARYLLFLVQTKQRVFSWTAQFFAIQLFSCNKRAFIASVVTVLLKNEVSIYSLCAPADAITFFLRL